MWKLSNYFPKWLYQFTLLPLAPYPCQEYLLKYFFNWVFVFLLLTCRISFSVLGIILLFGTYIANILSHTLSSLFYLFSPQVLNCFILCWGIQAVNNAVVVAGKQKRDSAIHTHASVLPQTPPFLLFKCYLLMSSILILRNSNFTLWFVFFMSKNSLPASWSWSFLLCFLLKAL